MQITGKKKPEVYLPLRTECQTCQDYDLFQIVVFLKEIINIKISDSLECSY